MQRIEWEGKLAYNPSIWPIEPRFFRVGEECYQYKNTA